MSLLSLNKDNGPGRHTALNLAVGTLGHLPGRFGIARLLGPSYSLRCVVFHDISASESPFTKGMRVSITPSDFEAALKFLTRYYTPVRLQDILGSCEGRSLPPRPLLVTFDDGYASLVKWALPLCSKWGVPAVLFLNSAYLDNEGLAPDNLVCYAANTLGMETINAAARSVGGVAIPELKSLAEVFWRFFPSISLPQRQVFLDTLANLGKIEVRQLAGDAGLYLARKQVRELAASGFEVGNHTYSHVHCRSLTAADFGAEIERNKAELEDLSGRKVLAFSVPYGSSADLTNDLVRSLQLSGHEAVFLSESVANPRGADRVCFDRVSIHANKDDGFFFEVEVLPRLRAVRSRLLRGPGFVRMSRNHPFRSRLGTPRGENKVATLDQIEPPV
jgi:peptidoglycan/xylan/chitin deacetylase (PgdA/CDA1 family)